MDWAIGRVLDTTTRALPTAGDHLVDLVHRAVTGKKVRGSPARALDELVDTQMLTPQAALYVASFRQVLKDVAQAISDSRQ